MKLVVIMEPTWLAYTHQSPGSYNVISWNTARDSNDCNNWRRLLILWILNIFIVIFIVLPLSKSKQIQI